MVISETQAWQIVEGMIWGWVYRSGLG